MQGFIDLEEWPYPQQGLSRALKQRQGGTLHCHLDMYTGQGADDRLRVSTTTQLIDQGWSEALVRSTSPVFMCTGCSPCRLCSGIAVCLGQQQLRPVHDGAAVASENAKKTVCTHAIQMVRILVARYTNNGPFRDPLRCPLRQIWQPHRFHVTVATKWTCGASSSTVPHHIAWNTS